MNFELFKDGKYTVQSSKEINYLDTIEIVNENCEFGFDSFTGCFSNDNLREYEVTLVITDEDLSNYNVAKSNNGGAYGFAKGVVTSVTSL